MSRRVIRILFGHEFSLELFQIVRREKRPLALSRLPIGVLLGVLLGFHLGFLSSELKSPAPRSGVDEGSQQSSLGSWSSARWNHLGAVESGGAGDPRSKV